MSSARVTDEADIATRLHPPLLPEEITEQYRDPLELALGIPFVDGNRLRILQNGDQIFPAMLEALELSLHSIDFMTYVYWSGDIAERFAEALRVQAKAGRSVRVLLDAFGAKEMSDELIERMQGAGVEVRWFRPLATWRVWRNDKRTHRKILVVDDLTGFTGGVGIADEWSGDARNSNEWRDTHFELEGPAVRTLKAAFLDNWNEAGAWSWDGRRDLPPAQDDGVPVQIIRASSTVGWSDTAGLLRSLVSVSQHRLSIVTPYFVPDDQLIELLVAAADRGVNVRIMIPGQHCDARLSQLAGQTSIAKLMIAGVEIWQYQKTMLHAKLLMVDGVLSCIGSANLNHRSMGKDEECCGVVVSSALTNELEERFDNDCESAQRIVLGDWKSRSAWTRIQERLARLLVEQL